MLFVLQDTQSSSRRSNAAAGSSTPKSSKGAQKMSSSSKTKQMQVKSVLRVNFTYFTVLSTYQGCRDRDNFIIFFIYASKFSVIK